ncbi:MAG: LURP-one-related/scramblase family protein [Acidimicrobiales bacterium]
MGFRDRKGHDGGSHRYQMVQKVLSVGGDSWIDDEDGNHVYKANGKALRVRKTFVLEDLSGKELAKIQEKVVTVRDKMHIEREIHSATVHKALVGLRERYKIDVDGGEDLKAHGNFVDHEYEIEDEHRTIATVSKKWFRARDIYGIEIAEGQDDVLLLSVAICIDALAHDH